MKYGTFIFAVTFALISQLHAATVSASGVAREKVLAAIDQATSGDIVMVPAGTATWSTPLVVNKAITLQGAGIGKTIVIDGLQKDDNNLRFVTKGADNEAAGVAPAKYRLTGFEFRDQGLHPTGSNGSPKQYLKGTVLFNGSSKNFRIDHCKFDVLNRATYFRNAVCGVIDHCQFVLDGTGAVTINHNEWPNPGGTLGAWGDGSWASPIDWGGPNAIYIEDNTFTGGPMAPLIDEYGGARFVFRYNDVTNTKISSHGTGSSGRYRGLRQWEIYNNTFTANPKTSEEAIHLRGGTGVIFGNAFTGFYKTVTLHTYRFHTTFPKWPGSDGTSAWDKNSPTVYLTGHAGIGSKDFTLVVTGANWTPNQWVGYTVTDAASSSLYPGGFFSAVVSNTKNRITVEAGSQVIDKPFKEGDYFEIRKVMQGLDMIGGSTGDLLPKVSSPAARWLNQAIEPAYIWNNKQDGVANAGIALADPPIKAGIHFYNNQPKPLYKPYIYPHPLVQ
jgi:hypothetical protein